MTNEEKPKTMTPSELTRWEVERRGYPEGIDYEALILAEQEEEEDGH